MSFNIGLSGMRAASSDLNITGNNIANAGTVGFKQSRAEFADVYSASILGSGKNTVGSGVLLSNVAQQFNQGNLSYTQNAMDLAINGNGFFQVSNNGAISYTRAGYFGTDNTGNIVDNMGYNLQGFTVDANGVLQTGGMQNLKIQTTSMEPSPTSKITQGFNLNSTSNVPTNSPFRANDATTYTSSTATNIYDGQGNAHTFTQYFIKDPVANSWTMHSLIDGAHPLAGDANAAGRAVVAAGGSAAGVLDAALNALPNPSSFRTAIEAQVTPMLGAAPAPSAEDVMAAVVRVGSQTPVSLNISFNTAGQLSGIGGIYDPASGVAPTADDFWVQNEDGTITLRQWTPSNLNGDNPAIPVANGAAANVAGVSLDMRSATQYASAFAVNSVSQDGYTTGELSGIEVSDGGHVLARYTNGQTAIQGQVVLADFANIQGLTPLGNTRWAQSYSSGEPVRNPPGSGTLGSLQAGALEDSNVELSDQLVNLIVAQRNYQANAKTIETESAITQTLINLR
jgi:flagellar hook protein FlgE